MAVIGITAAAANNIKAALQSYKNKVSKANPACDASISTVVIQKAIRGANTVNQIKNNINYATDNAEKILFRYIADIEKQLDEVVKSYTQNDAAASAITGAIRKS